MHAGMHAFLYLCTCMYIYTYAQRYDGLELEPRLNMNWPQSRATLLFELLLNLHTATVQLRDSSITYKEAFPLT